MARTITRVDLCNALKAKCKVSRQDASAAVDHIISETTRAIKDRGEVKIPLFGVFFSRRKNARIGRNPKTLEEAKITARTVAGFRVSRLMKQRVNDAQKKH